MKYFSLYLLSCVLFSCAEFQSKTSIINSIEYSTFDSISTEKIDKSTVAFIEFDNVSKTFGTIDKISNPHSEVYFRFKNTGSIPLVINKADVSCNCVNVEFPQKPFFSGEEGVIKAFIDATNQEGTLIKSIIIKSNAHNDYILLKVTGNVK